MGWGVLLLLFLTGSCRGGGRSSGKERRQQYVWKGINGEFKNWSQISFPSRRLTVLWRLSFFCFLFWRCNEWKSWFAAQIAVIHLLKFILRHVIVPWLGRNIIRQLFTTMIGDEFKKQANTIIQFRNKVRLEVGSNKFWETNHSAYNHIGIFHFFLIFIYFFKITS